MRNLLITISLAMLPTLVLSQNKVSEYISNYQHIAIAEMNRSGIPASITLAQGMFESAYGQSPSAISYNNHFGIKCKKEWGGPYFFKHDDDRDKEGNLIPSCFRAYETVDESFQDHTNFLLERERYSELFTYAQSDYFNWAMGLERCGYATNKMYGERLVEIIERYSLNQYDIPAISNPVLVSSEIPVDRTLDKDIAPLATDAFSKVVASSGDVMNTVNSTSEDIDAEHTKPLLILDSFKEFSSVSLVSKTKDPKPAPQSKVEQKVEKAPVSRVNRAIILPADYRRRAHTAVSQSSPPEKL